MTPKEASNEIGKVGKIFAKNTREFSAFMATNAAGLIKPRIHNDGLNAKEQPLSAYSVPYAKRRQKRGRRTDRKDLQFTDRLFQAEQVYNLLGVPVFGIIPGKRSDSNISNQELAGILEEKEKSEIFAPSESEFSKLDKIAKKFLDENFDKYFE